MKRNPIPLTILSLLLLTGMMNHVQAEPSNALKETLETLPKDTILKATFTQKRHLKDIPHALESSGEILLWAGKGLIWRTKTPFPNAILMTKKGLYQLDNEKKSCLVKEGKMGSDGAILDILSQILNGSFSDLEGFTVEERKPKKSSTWSIILLPPPAIQKVINSLVIDGSDTKNNHTIKQITIHRPNGDRDEISLNQPKIYSPAEKTQTLTPQEESWLND